MWIGCVISLHESGQRQHLLQQAWRAPARRSQHHQPFWPQTWCCSLGLPLFLPSSSTLLPAKDLVQSLGWFFCSLSFFFFPEVHADMFLGGPFLSLETLNYAHVISLLTFLKIWSILVGRNVPFLTLTGEAHLVCYVPPAEITRCEQGSSVP